MGQKNVKTEVCRQDQKLVYFADRELIEMFVNSSAVAKVDEAKRQIAEALGVDADEHIRVDVEMKFIVVL